MKHAKNIKLYVKTSSENYLLCLEQYFNPWNKCKFLHLPITKETKCTTPETVHYFNSLYRLLRRRKLTFSWVGFGFEAKFKMINMIFYFQGKKTYFFYWRECDVVISGVKPTYCKPRTIKPGIPEMKFAIDESLHLLQNRSADFIGKLYTKIISDWIELSMVFLRHEIKRNKFEIMIYIAYQS